MKMIASLNEMIGHPEKQIKEREKEKKEKMKVEKERDELVKQVAELRKVKRVSSSPGDDMVIMLQDQLMMKKQQIGDILNLALEEGGDYLVDKFISVMAENC